MTKRRDDGGFSLVELLVVMAILGILSAIAFPALAGQTRKAKLAQLKSTLKNAMNVQEQRATDDLPYATPGAAGVAELIADGLVLPPVIELTVVDDEMEGAGGGYCLRAHHTTLPDEDDLYYASSGPDAGRPTTTACEAS